MSKLLLFDVDGTLINTGGAGRRALKRAFESVHGDSSALDAIRFSGRTDRWIFASAFQAMGLDESQISDTVAAYLSNLPDELSRTAVVP